MTEFVPFTVTSTLSIYQDWLSQSDSSNDTNPRLGSQRAMPSSIQKDLSATSTSSAPHKTKTAVHVPSNINMKNLLIIRESRL